MSSKLINLSLIQLYVVSTKSYVLRSVVTLDEFYRNKSFIRSKRDASDTDDWVYFALLMIFIIAAITTTLVCFLTFAGKSPNNRSSKKSQSQKMDGKGRPPVKQIATNVSYDKKIEKNNAEDDDDMKIREISSFKFDDETSSEEDHKVERKKAKEDIHKNSKISESLNKDNQQRKAEPKKNVDSDNSTSVPVKSKEQTHQPNDKPKAVVIEEED